jgi:hypothetical protein
MLSFSDLSVARLLHAKSRPASDLSAAAAPAGCAGEPVPADSVCVVGVGAGVKRPWEFAERVAIVTQGPLGQHSASVSHGMQPDYEILPNRLILDITATRHLPCVIQATNKKSKLFPCIWSLKVLKQY